MDQTEATKKSVSKKIVINSILALGVVFFVISSLNSIRIDAAPESETHSANTASPSQPQFESQVQVFVFHATQRCPSCVAIGKFASSTIHEYFPAELASGQIEFREVNIDLLENKELAQKFKAAGSSLFINSIKNGQDNIKEDTNVWRYVFQEEQFKAYLKGKISGLL